MPGLDTGTIFPFKSEEILESKSLRLVGNLRVGALLITEHIVSRLVVRLKWGWAWNCFGAKQTWSQHRLQEHPPASLNTPSPHHFQTQPLWHHVGVELPICLPLQVPISSIVHKHIYQVSQLSIWLSVLCFGPGPSLPLPPPLPPPPPPLLPWSLNLVPALCPCPFSSRYQRGQNEPVPATVRSQNA